MFITVLQFSFDLTHYTHYIHYNPLYFITPLHFIVCIQINYFPFVLNNQNFPDN